MRVYCGMPSFKGLTHNKSDTKKKKREAMRVSKKSMVMRPYDLLRV
jgi:hypothetical protein